MMWQGCEKQLKRLKNGLFVFLRLARSLQVLTISNLGIESRLTSDALIRKLKAKLGSSFSENGESGGLVWNSTKFDFAPALHPMSYREGVSAIALGDSSKSYLYRYLDYPSRLLVFVDELEYPQISFKFPSEMKERLTW